MMKNEILRVILMHSFWINFYRLILYQMNSKILKFYMYTHQTLLASISQASITLINFDLFTFGAVFCLYYDCDLWTCNIYKIYLLVCNDECFMRWNCDGISISVIKFSVFIIVICKYPKNTNWKSNINIFDLSEFWYFIRYGPLEVMRENFIIYYCLVRYLMRKIRLTKVILWTSFNLLNLYFLALLN